MSVITRILKARVMGRLASEAAQRGRQRRARLRRRLAGARPTVHWFHQVDDPYSFLAVQRLDALAARYCVDVVPHLVPRPEAAYLGDADRHPDWALADARDLATFHGVEAPGPHAANALAAEAAAARLASADAADFARVAVSEGRGVWNGHEPAPPSATDRAAARDALARGERLRRRLGHYGGAVAVFEGDAWWGLDRLPLLEDRLRAEGLIDDPAAPRVVPAPVPEVLAGADAAGVVLEVFPSLRSPYTAIAFPAIRDLVARTGVEVRWRPVMPMLMRGVTAPRDKQLWILRDAAREGRRRGVVIGRPVDPFGEPVRRALSLWVPAAEAGRGEAFLAEYLHAAWIEGLDVTADAGLLEVVRRAGLDADVLRPLIGGDASDAELDANLAALNDAGLWGVPSFRVSGGGAPPFACWGQDRLWRVETEIARRATADPNATGGTG
jgi:2-hydroxychromene-2-carboxylate isomerase